MQMNERLKKKYNYKMKNKDNISFNIHFLSSIKTILQSLYGGHLHSYKPIQDYTPHLPPIHAPPLQSH